MGATFELHGPPQEVSSRILQVEQTLDQQSLSASHTFRHTRLHLRIREKPVSASGNCCCHRHTIHPVVSLPFEKCSCVSRSLEPFGRFLRAEDRICELGPLDSRPYHFRAFLSTSSAPILWRKPESLIYL